MRTGQRAMIALSVVLLLAAGVAIFLAAKTLVAGGDAHEAAPAERSPTSGAESRSADAGTSGCGEVAATDAYGNALGTLEPLVRGIHDAACRRDYPGLLPYMEDSFGVTGFVKEDVIAEWAREDSDEFLLRTLAETLETRTVGDQGGQYFCHPGGAVVVFARGTHDRPGKWSDFDLTGRRTPAGCRDAG